MLAVARDEIAPSYQTTSASIRSVAVLQGLPTTIFINAAGKTMFVHTGQYDSSGTLEQDVGTYALGGLERAVRSFTPLDTPPTHRPVMSAIHRTQDRPE